MWIKAMISYVLSLFSGGDKNGKGDSNSKSNISWFISTVVLIVALAFFIKQYIDAKEKLFVEQMENDAKEQKLEAMEFSSELDSYVLEELEQEKRKLAERERQRVEALEKSLSRLKGKYEEDLNKALGEAADEIAEDENVRQDIIDEHIETYRNNVSTHVVSGMWEVYCRENPDHSSCTPGEVNGESGVPYPTIH